MNNMMIYIITGVAAAGVLSLLVLMVMRRRRSRLNPDSFQAKWRALQKLCASKETWGQAIIDADKLLEDVLRKKRLGGKTQGERLTKAQRVLSDNEGVWFGHKLRLKIESKPTTRLKEKDVKQALVGIRQALKDLGALSDGKQ